MSTAKENSGDTSDSPKQQIKRPAFVYGKRSNQPRDQPSPPAFTSAHAERKGPHHTRTAPSEAQRSSPSPSIHSSDDEPSGTPFEFDFRRKMKQLDEGFDDNNEPVERIQSLKSIPSPSGQPTSAGPSPMKDIQVDPAPYSRGLSGSSAPRGSLSPPPSSLPDTFTQEQPPDSPPIPPRRRRVVKRAVSDSEAEEQSNSSSVSTVRHAITTPTVRASSTPPTSGEMPVPNKKSDNAKGKAPARDVLPLDFTSDIPSDVALPTKSKKGKRNATSSRLKTKAPTKKEQREALVESSRIAASRPVEIAHTVESRRSMLTFFASLQHHKIAMPAPRTELMSDPIERFSSPTDTSKATALQENVFGAPTGLLGAHAGTSKGPPPNTSTLAVALRAGSDDSDDDMPSVSAMIEANEKKKKLNAFKQIALQQANASKAFDGESEDDDLLIVKDDMHTVAGEEAAQRRLDKANGSPAKARAKFHALGHRGARKSDTGKLSGQDLREFARPSFARMGKRGREQLSKKRLDQLMIEQHREEQLKLIKQHEEEWVKGGGRLARDTQSQTVQASLSQTLGTYAEQGLQSVELGDGMAGIDDEASADESDEDYAPDLRGSASPEPMDAEEEVQSEQGDEMEVSQVQEPSTDNDDADATPLRRNKYGPRRATRVLPGSDDEDERLNSQEPIARRRDAGSSMESQTEDENDKENSAKLMYDRSEDKENKAVVRHGSSLTESSFGLRQGSQLGIGSGVRGSFSLASTADFSDATVAASPNESLRSPLKDISKDDDDLFASLSTSKSPFTERLRQSVATSPPRPSASTLSLGSPPVLRSEHVRRTSQLQFDSENDENDPSGFKPLQPSFLERLNSQASQEPSLAPANPLQNGGLSQLFSSEDCSAQAGKNELSLTLDVGLKPALEVSGTLRRKAETIFEKEQEYVVATAAPPSDKPKEVLYVNDHGFLTQTRPEGSSPGIYRMTPSQGSKYVGTQVPTQSLSERPPLRTLSFIASPDVSPGPQPLRRLHRRSASPLEHKVRGRNSSPVATPALSLAGPSTKLNAFDVLGKLPKPTSKAAHKEKPGKSEFVAAEAEESDEDDKFGFGNQKKDDDEDDDDDDDDDQDRVVEGLVDDAVMDAETEAADLVQEKYREHEEEEDRQLQKLHQDATEGKFRTKRRDRGVGFEDDSDDDDDDDDERRLRQRIHKKRKIAGDSLEALGQNEETQAFYNTYHQDLIDEDDEFKYLREGVPVPEDEDAQSEEPEERETVTVEEVRQRLREVAQNNTEVEVIDPEDLSWVDQSMAIDDDDHGSGGVRVKVMQNQSSRSTTRRPNVGPMEFDGERPKRQAENEQQRKQMLSWAKSQSHQYQGTGRSGTGAAVTGHSRIKGGNGSLRSSSQVSSSSSVSQGRSKAKAPSLLSTVSNRSGRFA